MTRCRVCGALADRVVADVPLCNDCWSVTPRPTRDALQNRTANRKAVIDAIAERRRSVAELKGGRHTPTPR